MDRPTTCAINMPSDQAQARAARAPRHPARSLQPDRILRRTSWRRRASHRAADGSQKAALRHPHAASKRRSTVCAGIAGIFNRRPVADTQKPGKTIFQEIEQRVTAARFQRPSPPDRTASAARKSTSCSSRSSNSPASLSGEATTGLFRHPPAVCPAVPARGPGRAISSSDHVARSGHGSGGSKWNDGRGHEYQVFR